MNPAGSASRPAGLPATGPSAAWSLRIEDARVAVVLGATGLPGGASLSELAIHLPHVGFPFDFREGIERFRHHRGSADVVEIAWEARLLLDWIHEASGGTLSGRAVDDTLVLVGAAGDARFTVRARLLPEAPGETGEGGDGLLVSLYDLRVYGYTDEPWPLLASKVLDLLPASLVAERTLTTARLRIVRPAVAWALSGLGWKLPDLAPLRARGVELRDGVLKARFVSPRAPRPDHVLTLEAVGDAPLRGAFERFVEDMELKRHHGQIDRLLEQGQVREALAEVWRALDGAPRPGFLAERLVGIAASRPILHDEAERVCRALLEASPGWPPALCGLAAIAIHRGRPEEAAVHLERLGSRYHGATEREDATLADLAVAELLADLDPEEARRALARVLERAPDHEEALERLIGLHETAGEAAQAVPLWKRLLFSARSPRRTREAGLRLARHALGRGDTEEARVFLKVVLETAPGDADARLALADAELADGRPLEAVRLLETALRVVPPSETGPLSRVVLRLAELSLDPLAEPGRARRVLWRAADAQGLDAPTCLSLARLALAAGDPELASRYAERVEPDEPSWPRAACLTARARLARGQRAEAIQAALRVLESAPGDEEALSLVEEAAAGVEVRERLLLQVRKASRDVEDPRTRARLHRAVARLYESLDLHADAIGPWEQALDATPGEPLDRDVSLHLLSLYARHGMWPRHQRLARRLLDEESDPMARVPLLVRFARASLDELGDPFAARQALEEAVSLAPRRVEALELLWRALEGEGGGDALPPILRRLVAVHPEEGLRRRAALRLAEVLLDSGSAGEARAVLQGLGAPEDPKVRRLLERAGARSSDAPAAAWQRALELGDRGETAEAVRILDALLDADPSERAAADLRAALLSSSPPPPAPARAPAPVASPRRTAVAPEPPSPIAAADLPAPVAQRLAEADRIEAIVDEMLGADDPAERLRLADLALSLDPDLVLALEARVDVLRRAGPSLELAASLGRLADLAFDARETLALSRERARILAAAGDDAGAHEGWRHVLEFAPLDAEAWEPVKADLRARDAWEDLVRLADRRAREADEAARDATDGGPFERLRARARLDEARARLFGLDDPDGAIAAAEDGLAASIDDPELLEVLVRALAMTNRREACRAALDRLLPQLLDGPLRDEMLLLRGGPA